MAGTLALRRQLENGWQPFAELEALRRRVERVFDELGDGAAHPWSLAVDVVEEDDRYVVRADVPGMSPDDVKIEVEDDILTIRAEHAEQKEEKEKNYVRRERRYGAFSRSLPLPQGVSPDEIEATCADGVLEVTFPKPKEQAREKVTITPEARA